jgi:maltose/moltooligosaccharide transporter
MKQLAWVQFFLGLRFFPCGFTPSAVTQHIYGTTDTTSEAYNTVANQVGEMFANYNLIAAIPSFFIATIGKIYESKIHFYCTCLRTWSYVYFITEPTVFTMEWLPMVGVGIAWQVFYHTYAMLSGSLPSDKMGYYMGVFNFFIVIPS